MVFRVFQVMLRVKLDPGDIIRGHSAVSEVLVGAFV